MISAEEHAAVVKERDELRAVLKDLLEQRGLSSHFDDVHRTLNTARQLVKALGFAEVYAARQQTTVISQLHEALYKAQSMLARLADFSVVD